MESAAVILNVRRAVVAITPLEDGSGWLVELDCGHKEEWQLDPPTGTATCRACLALIAERMNAL